MRIDEILKNLALPESTTPQLDLELLLTKALEKPRSFLYANKDYKLTTNQVEILLHLYKRRLGGEPIAYILGKKEFWSMELMVNENVLIPRPETETLIERVLQLELPRYALIADLGTGSGAIALALAKERPYWQIIATDISKEALKIANHNTENLSITNIEFHCGDWCSILPNTQFDLIVSNPPYIAKNDPHLQQGDVRFEPKIALESADGFTAIKTIIMQAKNRLKNNGFIALEHGHNQSKSVQNLLQQNNYQNITSYQDLAGITRGVIASYN